MERSLGGDYADRAEAEEDARARDRRGGRDVSEFRPGDRLVKPNMHGGGARVLTVIDPPLSAAGVNVVGPSGTAGVRPWKTPADLPGRWLVVPAGEPLPTPETSPPRARRRDGRSDEIVAALNRGDTLASVGDRLGITRERVRQIADGHPDLLPAADRRAARRAAFYDSVSAEIEEALSAGESYGAVAARVGVSHGTVRTIARAAAIGRGRVASRVARGRTISRVTRRWSDDDLLAVLREAAAIDGTPGIGVARYLRLRRDGRVSGPTPPIFASRFGSWNDAVAAAGLKPHPRPVGMGEPRFDVYDHLETIERVHGIVGKVPSMDEMRSHRRPSEPTPDATRVAFGTWTAALAAWEGWRVRRDSAGGAG